MKKYTFLLIISLLVFGLSGWAMAGEATIIETNGTVDVKPDATSGWQSASVNMVIRDGARISTGLNSWVKLSFANGSELRINALTQYTVNSMSSTSDRVSSSGTLRLGSVEAHVLSSGSTRSDFSVSTPRGTASVRGTVFTVSYSPENGISVFCDSGSVDLITLNNSIVNVDGNQGANVGPTSGPNQIRKTELRNAVNLFNNNLSPEEQRAIRQMIGPGLNTPAAQHVQDQIIHTIFEDRPERL